MIKHTPPNAGQIAKLESCLDNLRQAANATEKWLKAHIADMPGHCSFYITAGETLNGWTLEISIGTNRHELAASSLIAHIEQYGKINFDELMDYEV